MKSIKLKRLVEENINKQKEILLKRADIIINNLKESVKKEFPNGPDK